MIELRLSGGASNANPAGSLGGAMSSAVVPVRPFPVVTQALRDIGITWYLYAYVRADAAHDDVRAWVVSETPYAGTSIAVGWGAAQNVTRSVASNNSIVPAGVTFSAASSYLDAVAGDNYVDGDFRSLIIRFTLNAGSSLIPLDQFLIGVGGSPLVNPDQMLDFSIETNSQYQGI